MQVTVGQIIRLWPSPIIPNCWCMEINCNQNNSIIIQNFASNEQDFMVNYMCKYVYVNQGNIVTWNDGSIRITDINHNIIGNNVEID